MYINIYVLCLRIIVVNGACEAQCYTVRMCDLNYLLKSTFAILSDLFLMNYLALAIIYVCNVM